MGEVGVVNAANTVRQWLVDYIEDDRPYAASNTAQGTQRGCGILDWTGRYSTYGDPIIFAGDTFAFIGDATTGAGASGSAITERIVLNWEHERNGYLNSVVFFAGNGDLTLTGDASDATFPAAPCSSVLPIKVDDVALTDVRRAELDIMCRYGKPPGQIGNRPYSSSTVPGKMRRLRSRLDFKITVDVYTSDFSALPQPQSAAIWKMYTTGSVFWELKWARVIGLLNMGAHPENSELVAARIVAVMRGSDGSETGYIKSPGAVQEWPYAAGT
tara:strand:- start:339 stop:1154 length:816 start_codon:yes stop_codon:yes gene_type:complete